MFQSWVRTSGSTTTSFGLLSRPNSTHSRSASPSARTTAVSRSATTATSTGIRPGAFRTTSTRVIQPCSAALSAFSAL